MLCSVTVQAKKKVSMKRVACITISVNQEEFETDDDVNYFVGEFCAFCEQNGIAARVNNTTGTINRTTIRPSFGHSIYLAYYRMLDALLYKCDIILLRSRQCHNFIGNNKSCEF